MDVKSYSHLRQNLASAMDEVAADGTTLVITRRRAKPVVMLSLDEYNAMTETLHLLRSPRNAARLLKSYAEIKAGRARARKQRQP